MKTLRPFPMEYGIVLTDKVQTVEAAYHTSFGNLKFRRMPSHAADDDVNASSDNNVGFLRRLACLNAGTLVVMEAHLL